MYGPSTTGGRSRSWRGHRQHLRHRQRRSPRRHSGGIAPPVTLLILGVDCGALPGTGGASGGSGGASGGSGGLSGQGGDGAGTGGTIGAGTGGTIGAGTGGTIGAGTGGTIGAGTGGTIGAGTGGAIGAGTGGTSGCGALVDDMEANNGKICEGNGRAGHWFTYIDSYSGSSITPSPSTVPALPYELTTPRTGSRYAMRAFGTYTSYAGIAALVNNAVIGQAPRTFNASSYTGVRFTAMGSGGIRLVVQTSATESTTYGGTCTLASCYGAKYYVASGLSPAAWNTFSVPFTSLARATRPSALPTCGASSSSRRSGGSYDIWIDDVTFY